MQLRVASTDTAVGNQGVLARRSNHQAAFILRIGSCFARERAGIVAEWVKPLLGMPASAIEVPV